MLTSLQIRDFAIIDAVEVEWRGGLTVLTGETGAGKSIVVDALQFLAGGRAGAEVVRHGAQRAEVAATFDVVQGPRALKRWLEEQAISCEAELTVRRIAGQDGRSRGFLNGQASPLQLLRDVGNILIDIHGQHEFQSLVRSAAQRELLDGFGRLDSLTAQVGIAHRVWLEILNRSLDLEGRARDREARLEFLRHQERELHALQLVAREFDELTEERARLANHGRLADGAQAALLQLFEEDAGSAHASVSRALQALKSLAAVDAKLASVATLVGEAGMQIREAARELQHYLDGLELDTGRQNHVEERLAAIEELARKHRVKPADLPERAHALSAELDALERVDTDIASLKKDQAAALENYRSLAQQLSARRTTAGRQLAKDITLRMQSLGMTGGRFSVEVTPHNTAEPAVHGLDQIEFRVTANPGQPLRPLAKVASGGELSRLSLGVQVSCAARDPRCMIFDEVDAGIGGAVAEIVGRELRALGESGQVICVTHLPQVASQGHQHLRVTKVSDGKTTRTHLALLTPAERIEELARMLGGIEVTAKARAHAGEMLRAVAPAAPAVSATGKRRS
jgi:DNA repair protein RecN (Recombination protein N)